MQCRQPASLYLYCSVAGHADALLVQLQQFLSHVLGLAAYSHCEITLKMLMNDHCSVRALCSVVL